MLGVLFRLFKLAWYLIWLPVHIAMVSIAAIVACLLMVIDIPLWVLFGRYGILSYKIGPWHTYHLDKILGE